MTTYTEERQRIRGRFALLMVLVLGVTLGVVVEAKAAVTVDIIWTSTTGAGVPGGASIDALPGDQLVAEVRVTPDAGGVIGYSVSLAFDSDLGDELDLVSATEFLPGTMEVNFSPGVTGATVESTGASAGLVNTIEAVVLTVPGPTTGTFVAGEVTFAVTANVATDGDDVFVGEFNAATDGVGNNAFTFVTPVFVHAAVNKVAVSTPALSMPAMFLTIAGLLYVARRYHTAARP